MRQFPPSLSIPAESVCPLAVVGGPSQSVCWSQSVRLTWKIRFKRNSAPHKTSNLLSTQFSRSISPHNALIHHFPSSPSIPSVSVSLPARFSSPDSVRAPVTVGPLKLENPVRTAGAPLKPHCTFLLSLYGRSFHTMRSSTI